MKWNYSRQNTNIIKKVWLHMLEVLLVTTTMSPAISGFSKEADLIKIEPNSLETKNAEKDESAKEYQKRDEEIQNNIELKDSKESSDSGAFIGNNEDIREWCNAGNYDLEKTKAQNPDVLEPDAVLKNNILLRSSNNTTEIDIDGLKYNVAEGKDNTATIVGYANEPSGYIYIPETIKYNNKTYIVDSVGDRAFYGCEKLTGILIPKSVVSIGERAFYNSNLKYLMILSKNLSVGPVAIGGTPLKSGGRGSSVYIAQNAALQSILKDLEITGEIGEVIHIIPSVPSIENIKFNINADKLELSWDPVTDADGYILIRRDKNMNESILDSNLIDTKYIDNLGLEPVDYAYFIKAYVNYTSPTEDLKDPFKNNIKIEGDTSKININFHKVLPEISKYGNIIVDKDSAVQGQKVTITAKPYEGYNLSRDSLKINSGKVSVNSIDDTTFNFIMPGEDVNITAQFSEILNNVDTSISSQTKQDKESVLDGFVNSYKTSDIMNIFDDNVLGKVNTSDKNLEVIVSFTLLTIASSLALFNKKIRRKK